MTTGSFFQLEIDGCSLTWRVAEIAGRECLHASFAFLVIAEVARDADATEPLFAPEPEGLITRRACLSWPLEDSGARTIEGEVDEVTRSDCRYEIVIAPRSAALADGVDYRVFVDKDAVAIANEVLSEHGIRVDARVTRAPPKRAQCVQSFESTLAFISRILAEEGVTWFAARDAPATIVFADSPTVLQRLPGTLPLIESAGLVTERSMSRARIVRRIVPEKVTLRDFDDRAPKVDLTVEASVGARGERYEFPGGFREAALGKVLAGMRLDEHRTRRIVLEAETNARDLAPGCIVTLAGAAPGVSGEWLLAEVTHEGSDHGAEATERRYVARFTALPATAPYRPERGAGQRSGGVQTATTTGPEGHEIHTDDYGSVKALLRWDRGSPKDDHSSAWIRPMHPPISGGFLLPRVGWEALLGFSRTSSDVPIALGRLYNGVAPPPSGLPRAKVVSAFGTRTTPGGGSANLVAMDDSAGSEAMTFGASRDFNERTENDKVTTVVADATARVAGNRNVSVGQVHELEVDGAQTRAVAGDRKLDVGANLELRASSERITIGSTRDLKIGGDLSTACSSVTRAVGGAKATLAIEHETREVGGASAVLVGGSWNAVAGVHASVMVAGASAELVAGPKRIVTGRYFLGVKGALDMSLASWSISTGASHELGFGADASFETKGSATMKGASVVFSAESRLVVKASGVSIEITPNSVTIQGRFDAAVASVDHGDETYA